MMTLKKKKKKKKKLSTSKKMLIVVVIAITAYTAAAFILQFFTSVEISSTLTASYFTFWTGEVIVMAGIKTSKVKHDYTSTIEEDL